MDLYRREITDVELLARAAKYKPLVKHHDVIYHLEPFTLEQMKNTSFIWDPKLAAPAGRLVNIRRITTYHSWAYYGFFKPSIAEVLSFIDDRVARYWHDGIEGGPVANCFMITETPETVEDMNRDPSAFDAGYHVAVTTLFQESEGN
jgi:hypothetical protein